MGYALEELGPERCAQIAGDLFKVEREYGQKLHGFCPIHGDKSSASFVYHAGEDWYKCRSCQAGGDLVKLWCELGGLDSRGEGFRAFKAEFVDGIGLGPGPRPRPPVPKAAEEKPEVLVGEEDLAALPPLPAQRVAELQEGRGWSPSVVEALDLREFTDQRGAKRIAIPVRDDQGRLCNIRLYQPGAAEFKVISWFDQRCRACGGAFKRGKKRVCKECGGLPNDYGRTRLFPNPGAWKKAGTLWLLEGEPDVVCALSQGLNAVTQTAGCGTWREEFSEAMKGRDVVIAYDADQPGWKGAMEAAGPSIAKYARSVRVLLWPEMMGGEGHG